MSLDAKSAARPVSAAAPASLARVRRGSLAVLVLVVLEFGIGMYVNLPLPAATVRPARVGRASSDHLTRTAGRRARAQDRGGRNEDHPRWAWRTAWRPGAHVTAGLAAARHARRTMRCRGA
jgi:hypothetical protein